MFFLRLPYLFCQFTHSILITRNKLIDYSVLDSDSVKKMAQTSQNKLRSPREHQMGRIRVYFRVPCVLEVVNFDTKGTQVNDQALLSK